MGRRRIDRDAERGEPDVELVRERQRARDGLKLRALSLSLGFVSKKSFDIRTQSKYISVIHPLPIRQ